MKRLSGEERDKVLLDVARLYCEGGSDRRGLNLTDVAHEIARLHPKVRKGSMQMRRYLDEAKARGIVTFIYDPPRLKLAEERLKARYPFLEEVRVVPPSPDDFAYQRRNLGQAGAKYFEENVGAGMKVAVGGGTTVAAMIAALTEERLPAGSKPDWRSKLDIYPTALIGRGPLLEGVTAEANITSLWLKTARTGRTAGHYTTVLPFEDDSSAERVRAENRRLIATHNPVSEVCQGMREVDFVFTSLGPIDPPPEYVRESGSRLSTLMLLSRVKVPGNGQDAVTWLRREAVGDIGNSYFDAKGETRSAWEFFIALGVAHFKRMVQANKKVVVIAGKHKTVPLRGALAGKMCNVLITDELTANAVLE